MAAPFRISPSTIARYFFHDCERFLYYTSATPQERKRQGIPTPEFDRSPLVASILASGYQWEREVIERLLKGKVVVSPGSGELHTRRLSLAQTLRHLRREPAGKYLYQPTLDPPKDFYRTYGIDPKLVAINENHPDLLAVLAGEDGRRILRVIDLKRGEALKLTHRVQILFYALELQSMLDAEGIEAEVDLERGAVWLGKQEQPEVFNLSDFRPHLERFLRDELKHILQGEAREAHWHLYDRCEWCEFFDSCREEMRRTDSVSRVAHLTSYGKRHLVEEAGVHTLVELGRFLKRRDADEVLDRCASLAGQRHRLAAHVAALESSEPQLHGAASPDLPRGENLAVFLTLQKEPLGQTIYLAGLHVTGREEVRRAVFSSESDRLLSDGEGKPQPAVWLADRPNGTADVCRSLILCLDDLFRRVHRYNEAHAEWKDKLSLQAYVHTEEERSLLFAALLQALNQPDLAEKAMTLLFHFQGPELMQATQHPGSEVAYPVVVLQNAIGRLLALPVEVSYTLPEMLAALGSPFRYTRRDYFHFPLGHGLRAEALHAAWYDGKAANLEEIQQQARLYLFALAALLRAVRERAEQHLFAWPPRFTLPTGAGIREPLLSRLAFFARYESLLGCLAIREARAEARATQVLLGQVLELKAINANEMEVVGHLVVEPETSGFPAWLLVRDNDEGRRAQVEYADYWYRNKIYGGPDSPHRAIVGLTAIHTTAAGATRLRLEYARKFKNNPPKAGERFLLYQRFTDFTTDPIVGFLEKLDHATENGEGPARLFVRMLRHPEEASEPLPLPAKVRTAAMRWADQLDFTPSQREAYRTICAQRITAVWGPPGTGKTHFLAAAVVALASSHARAGLPFRVLVTAFTHAAIENLLAKIAERRRVSSDKTLDLLLGKAKHWQGVNPGIEVVPESDLGGWLTDSAQVVLGATAHSCVKKIAELPPFDLVVVDEASQVRVPESSVAVYLTGESGRLVLAGDHLQLPPIVAGTYPQTPPGEPLLHRSIFEAVCPREGNITQESHIVRQLLENFRMNDVLTRCAGDLLYGPRYRCGSEAIARRRLAFQPRHDLDPLVASCLDPDYPLVVVVLDGIRASRANPIEADLIAQLTAALREGLRNSSGRLYVDDAAFFRHGVFIVSPHHAQIRAIQQELARQRSWSSLPFVDTVDKMQGQEADAVLVSYGVSDPEFALREAEFIYGLNRLNVAITRARCKTVVCLPRPLLEASPQVLDVEAAAAGLGFMRRLVDWIRRHGEELLFEGENVEARVLRAASEPVA
jgi:DNA replication ATP-dependent helicase Dna2